MRAAETIVHLIVETSGGHLRALEAVVHLRVEAYSGGHFWVEAAFHSRVRTSSEGHSETEAVVHSRIETDVHLGVGTSSCGHLRAEPSIHSLVRTSGGHLRAAETIVHLKAVRTDVHFFVGNVLGRQMPNQDEGEVHCEVTIIQSADAESGNPGIENSGQADIDMRQQLAIGLLLEVVELLPTPKRRYLLRALLHNGGRAYLLRVGVVEVGWFLDALLHEGGRAQLLSDAV